MCKFCSVCFTLGIDTLPPRTLPFPGMLSFIYLFIHWVIFQGFSAHHGSVKTPKPSWHGAVPGCLWKPKRLWAKERFQAAGTEARPTPLCIQRAQHAHEVLPWCHLSGKVKVSGHGRKAELGQMRRLQVRKCTPHLQGAMCHSKADVKMTTPTRKGRKDTFIRGDGRAPLRFGKLMKSYWGIWEDLL
jgi:hypothetical protein